MNNTVNKHSLLELSSALYEKGKMVRLRVKEIAESKGFNISSLARESGLGFSTVKRIWRDPYRETSTITLEKIAKALGVPTGNLIEDVPEEK